MLQPISTSDLLPDKVSDPATRITVSVIVPMRNEEKRISACLRSILANDFDQTQIEILVVDGRSTDRSRAIVQEWAAQHKQIRLLDNPAKIVSSGLNLGIRQAQGAIIIIMGAHAEYASNYIYTCVTELGDRHADVVGGVLETRPGDNGLVARAIALMSQHRFGVGGSAFRTGRQDGYVDTVPYGAYRKEVFARVGLFNEGLTRNQDFELNTRIHIAGGRLFLSTQTRSAYYNVSSLGRLIRQAFTNGFWLPPMWLACPKAARLRHAIPALFVAILLVSLLVMPWFWIASVPGVVALATYAIIVAYVAGEITWKSGTDLFLPLVAAFFLHHIAYGAGTLAGLLACFAPAPRNSQEPGPATN